MQNINQDKKISEASSASRVDSSALQEIIDIMKYPFQTSCDRCNGLGFVRSGDDCPSCNGNGKVLDDLFR